MNTASSAVARRTHWGEWVVWFTVLGIVTAGLLAIRARINEAHVALAYLIVVQAGSARRGRGLGIALAVASFLCFDIFFLPPYGTVAIESPLNWLALIAFLGTGIVSAELLYRVQAERAHTLEAAHRAKDAVLASVSHDLRTPLTTIKALAHEIAEARRRPRRALSRRRPTASPRSSRSFSTCLA